MFPPLKKTAPMLGNMKISKGRGPDRHWRWRWLGCGCAAVVLERSQRTPSPPLSNISQNSCAAIIHIPISFWLVENKARGWISKSNIFFSSPDRNPARSAIDEFHTNTFSRPWAGGRRRKFISHYLLNGQRVFVCVYIYHHPLALLPIPLCSHITIDIASLFLIEEKSH